jgi:hypothetical protein
MIRMGNDADYVIVYFAALAAGPTMISAGLSPRSRALASRQ